MSRVLWQSSAPRWIDVLLAAATALGLVYLALRLGGWI